MAAPDPSVLRRRLAALLSYLEAGRAEIAATGAGRVKLARPGEAGITVREVLVAAALGGGLVSRNGAGLALGEAGRMALGRLAARSPEAFASQHRTIEMRAGADGPVAVNLAESPLAAHSRLKRRDGSLWFPPELVDAGERLRSDFTRGSYLPGLSARHDVPASRGTAARAGGIADLADAALAARMRVEAAVQALGPELSGVVLDVCCFLKGLEVVERERQWPPRSAKLLLRAGLEALHRHYAPAGRRGGTQTRHWGGEGFRPDLSGDLR